MNLRQKVFYCFLGVRSSQIHVRILCREANLVRLVGYLFQLGAIGFQSDNHFHVSKLLGIVVGNERVESVYEGYVLFVYGRMLPNAEQSVSHCESVILF